MPLSRRRGGGREDESGLVEVDEEEEQEEESRGEMEQQPIRPTGQMYSIRSSIPNIISWLSCLTPSLAKLHRMLLVILKSDQNDILARGTRAWTTTPTTTRS